MTATGFCLLVVAKAPVPGQAKTRLSPPMTPHQAADIASASLLDTLAAVAATPNASPVVAMTGQLAAASRSAELRAALAPMYLLDQRGPTFADRLANAHTDTAALLPGLPIVQIGMDTPQVTADLLADLAALLTDADAVLGPAEDGGWWALGLRDPRHATALRDVPMSTPDTAQHTLDALRRTNLTPHIAPTLSDVDTFADAIRVARAAPGKHFPAAVHAATHPTDTVGAHTTTPTYCE